MKMYKKTSRLNNVLFDVRGAVVREALHMEKYGTQVLKMNIGNPAMFGFKAPGEIINKMREAISEAQGYSDSQGIFEAREAVAWYARGKGFPDISAGDVYIGNGVSELIQIALQALLNEGDEILIPSPDYPLWTGWVRLCGGKAVHYICDEQSEWCPDAVDIQKKVTDKTKAIVLINPNNPTGAVYPRESLMQIVDIARKHGLMIFSDEIYDRSILDNEEHISAASLAPDLFCITFSGLSKSHMICGFRVGWMILSGSKQLVGDYIKGIDMLANMRICSNVPGQYIVKAALTGMHTEREYVVSGNRIYEQREFVYNALKSIPGVTVIKPKAAFYIYPRLDAKRFNITDDNRFAMDFLKEKQVLVVPGSGFNWNKPDHFRVVYLAEVPLLKDFTERLEDFLKNYRQK